MLGKVKQLKNPVLINQPRLKIKLKNHYQISKMHPKTANHKMISQVKTPKTKNNSIITIKSTKLSKVKLFNRNWINQPLLRSKSRRKINMHSPIKTNQRKKAKIKAKKLILEISQLIHLRIDKKRNNKTHRIHMPPKNNLKKNVSNRNLLNLHRTKIQ